MCPGNTDHFFLYGESSQLNMMTESERPLRPELVVNPGRPIHTFPSYIYQLIPTNLVPVHQQVNIFRRSGIPGSLLELLPGQFVFIPVQPVQDVRLAERLSGRQRHDRNIRDVFRNSGQALSASAEERAEYLNPLAESEVWQSAYSLIATTSRQIMHHQTGELGLVNSSSTDRANVNSEVPATNFRGRSVSSFTNDFVASNRVDTSDRDELVTRYSTPHITYLTEHLIERVTNLIPESLQDLEIMLGIHRQVKKEGIAQQSIETSTENSGNYNSEEEVNWSDYFDEISLNEDPYSEEITDQDGSNVPVAQMSEGQQCEPGRCGFDSPVSNVADMTPLDVRALRNRIQYDWSLNINDRQTDDDTVADDMMGSILHEVCRNMTARDNRVNNNRFGSFRTYFNNLYYQFFYETFLWMYFAILTHPRSVNTWALLQIIADIAGQPPEDVTISMLAGYLEGSISQSREGVEALDSMFERVERDGDVSPEIQTSMQDSAMLMNIRLEPRRLLRGFSEVIRQAARTLLIDTGATVPAMTQR